MNQKLRTNTSLAHRMILMLGLAFFELRVLFSDKDKAPIRGYFNDPVAAASAAATMSERGDVKGVYITVNELYEQLTDRATNRFNARQSTKDDNIKRRRFIVLDIDPKKPDGMTDHPATDVEHAAALELANKAIAMGRALGWPAPLLVSSGNGVYVIYRIDLPNDPANKRRVNRVLKAFAAQLDNEHAHVDTSVGNASRIFRLAGTINRKGDNSNDRPYRMADIISAPEGDKLDVVTQEQLDAFAGADEGTDDDVYNELTRERIDDDKFAQHVRCAKRFVEMTGIGIEGVHESDDRTRIDLAHCSRGPEHKADGNPAIIIWRSGHITYKCFHNNCQGISFREFQKKVGVKFSDAVEEEATLAVTGQIARPYHDPLVLAHQQLKNWRHSDGTSTLAFFHGQIYRYDDKEGWVETNLKELAPWIRETVQDVFDNVAGLQGELTRSSKVPRVATQHVVAETYKALESLCKHTVPLAAAPPLWLGNEHPWDAKDVICFNNGILNIRAYVSGEADCFTPLTPKLFYEYQSPFDFDPMAPAPREFHKFLASLEQGPAWITCLQQIMGYCLWLNYDLQKYFHFVGPPRSGKGTLIRVIKDQAGGERAVCSPRLSDFISEFGLQPAIGKRLALVPEARVPKSDAHEIVEKIKAITGGDAVAINRKNLPIVSMQLKVRIFMSTNHFVALPDSSGALQTRVLPLRFSKSFVGKEDRDLPSKLAHENPGILNWSLEGLTSLVAAGGDFTLPQSTQDELTQLQSASAPLRDFVDECCSVDTRKGVQCPALYEIYKEWLGSARPNETPLSEKEFAIELRSTVSTIRKERANKPAAINQSGCDIATTDFDDVGRRRPYLWLGICPHAEWAKKDRFDALVGV